MIKVAHNETDQKYAKCKSKWYVCLDTLELEKKEGSITEVNMNRVHPSITQGQGCPVKVNI
jgi:hypothetical protein